MITVLRCQTLQDASVIDQFTSASYYLKDILNRDKINMRKASLNTKGFGLVAILLGVVILAVIGGAGAYVYHKNHKTKTSNTTSSSKGSSGTQNKPPTPVDPYVGWKTATLKYEQATFKYPASWQVSNTSKDEAGTGGTVTPGSDEAVLTSPSGLTVHIDTGEAGFNNATDTILSTDSIATLGGSYHLVFYTHDSSNLTTPQAACVSATTVSGASFGFVPSKNIRMTGTNASAANNSVCLEYDNAQGSRVAKPVSTFKQDASYNDAKLIVESLAY